MTESIIIQEIFPFLNITKVENGTIILKEEITPGNYKINNRENTVYQIINHNIKSSSILYNKNKLDDLQNNDKIDNIMNPNINNNILFFEKNKIDNYYIVGFKFNEKLYGYKLYKDTIPLVAAPVVVVAPAAVVAATTPAVVAATPTAVVAATTVVAATPAVVAAATPAVTPAVTLAATPATPAVTPTVVAAAATPAVVAAEKFVIDANTLTLIPCDTIFNLDINIHLITNFLETVIPFMKIKTIIMIDNINYKNKQSEDKNKHMLECTNQLFQHIIHISESVNKIQL